LDSDCQQPDGDDRRFAETGGDIEGVRQIPGDHLGPQPLLPPKGRVSSECLVVFVHASSCRIFLEIKQLQIRGHLPKLARACVAGKTWAGLATEKRDLSIGYGKWGGGRGGVGVNIGRSRSQPKLTVCYQGIIQGRCPWR